jgi:hypothetical protein
MSIFFGEHAVARLQAEATRVEHDALTHERKVTGGVLRGVGEPHHTRRLLAATVHADHAAAAHLGQLVLVEHLHREAARPTHLLRLLGHHPRRHVGGRQVGEIAGEVRRTSGDGAALGAGGDALRTGLAHRQHEVGEVALVGVLLDATEAVGGEQRALGNGLPGARCVDTRQVGQRRGHHATLAGGTHHRRSGGAQGRHRQRGRIADADGDHRGALTRRHHQRLAHLALEAVGGEGGTAEAERTGHGTRRAHGHANGLGRLGNGTGDLHGCGHGAQSGPRDAANAPPAPARRHH